MRAYWAAAIVLGFLCGLLITAQHSASADHPFIKDGKRTLWSEFLPGVGSSVPYSLCSFDPDGLPRNNDGDEYVPDEYQTALNGWKLYFLAFTPMRISWQNVGGDCDQDVARLRVAAQVSVDVCQLACEQVATVDAGAYEMIQSADVYVQDGWFQNMGQWKQTVIYHEMGHILGLADHAVTQCNYDGPTASGFYVFMLMQQYDSAGTLLNPCAPDPTLYDLLGAACTAYSYDCADVNNYYTLVFGPSPMFRDNTPVHVWLLAELGNTYGDEDAVVSANMTPGVPSGCNASAWARFMPGSSPFGMLSGERRFALFRKTISCGASATPGVYPQTFGVCIDPAYDLDLLPLYQCATQARSLIIFN